MRYLLFILLLVAASPVYADVHDFPHGNILNDNKAFRGPVRLKDISYLYAPLFIHSAEKTFFISDKEKEVHPRDIYLAHGAMFRSESNEFRAVLSNNVVLQFLEPSKFYITEFLQEPYKELITRREPSSSRLHGFLSYGTLYISLPELHPNSAIVIDTPFGHIQCLGGRCIIRVDRDFIYIEVVAGTFVFSSSNHHQASVTLIDNNVCVGNEDGNTAYTNVVHFEETNKAILRFPRSRTEIMDDLTRKDIIIRRENFFMIYNGEYEYPDQVPVPTPPNKISPSQHP